MSDPITIEPVKEIKRITLEEKQNVQYCVEPWVRDENVKRNNSKVKGRIEAHQDLRSEPIALVNFGPSLNETWEKIKEFKYVMTCSGAHKFCVDHGIVPTHHIDVDPREHKIKLIGTPQKGTEYLISSACSPKLFDFLIDAGCDVKLWHIFDNDEHGLRVLPHGEWAITGGCSVGVRTMTLARFLGFTDQHIFGMDGCFGSSGTHAAEHPNKPRADFVLDYEGKEYHTTPSMLEAVKNTWHELDMMKDVRATFYGDGLVQAMSRNYKRAKIEGATFIAFNKPELISAEYLELNKRLHADNIAYGVGGGRHAPLVLKLARSIAKNKPEGEFVSILDFGCGKGYLGKALDFPIGEYDPAIDGKDSPPRPADLVCCLDVLEHIEPDRLDYVLGDLLRCTKQLGLFIIYTEPSQKCLADGRNAHLIVEGEEWWTERIKQFFHVPKNGVTYKKPLLYFIVAPKPKSLTALGQKMKSTELAPA